MLCNLFGLSHLRVYKKINAKIIPTLYIFSRSRDPLVTELQASCKDLQSALKDLRTDNEAKRSELFDLRAKLDQKVAQIEEQQGRLKARDRTITELRNQVSSKFFKNIRCRRGLIFRFEVLFCLNFIRGMSTAKANSWLTVTCR